MAELEGIAGGWGRAVWLPGAFTGRVIAGSAWTPNAHLKGRDGLEGFDDGDDGQGPQRRILWQSFCELIHHPSGLCGTGLAHPILQDRSK